VRTPSLELTDRGNELELTAPGRVDWALGHAPVHHRFGEGDLALILAAHPDPTITPPALRAG